jgi:hypothetical protein
MTAPKTKLEYGDYQTPPQLAEASCRVLIRLGMRPRTILEPTCGLGNFLKAGVDGFETVVEARGFDINPEYVSAARKQLAGISRPTAVVIEQANFFDMNWGAIVASLPEPLLVVGNPPWVTNSALGVVRSCNLPKKSNFQRHTGLDAVTGKSNFDISEYMLIRLSEALQKKDATLAMLCKTAVARKLMAYCWKRNLEMGGSHMFLIDTQRYFGAAVDACLFVASFSGRAADRSCIVHQDFDLASRCHHLGYRDGLLVSDVEQYEGLSFLRAPTSYTWRSGVKHDCAKVMEFRERDGKLVNGFGETVQLEDDFLYPLLKSSDIAGLSKSENRQVLVTQRNVGENTAEIARIAPRTWQYLLEHSSWLDARASIIYKKRPRFCVFGVGGYSFAPWKVVISGFYKKLEFKIVGPRSGRPVMLDDTAYFLGSNDEAEARLLAEVLNSTPARRLLSSLIFWDAKRPITVDVLSQVSMERLAIHLGKDLLSPTNTGPKVGLPAHEVGAQCVLPWQE